MNCYRHINLLNQEEQTQFSTPDNADREIDGSSTVYTIVRIIHCDVGLVYVFFRESRPRSSHWAILPLIVRIWVNLLSNFRDELRKTHHASYSNARYGRSRSSKVVDFGGNLKGTWDFI